MVITRATYWKSVKQKTSLSLVLAFCHCFELVTTRTFSVQAEVTLIVQMAICSNCLYAVLLFSTDYLTHCYLVCSQAWGVDLQVKLIICRPKIDEILWLMLSITTASRCFVFRSFFPFILICRGVENRKLERFSIYRN